MHGDHVTPTSRSAFGSARRQITAGTIYFMVFAALAASALWLVDDLKAKSDRVAAAQARLDEFAARSPRGSASAALDATRSPFLDGKTVTIAGAALEQRMSEVVGKAGGDLLSAQVELEGPEAKQGFIGLTTSVQVGQATLQDMLYDIEAGLPYLFIDKLSIQSPEDFGEPETGLMRITMTVAGQWRAEK
jgi:general secretion pathway protein M